jgi:t-SNARE complex subunit (syntaxin)
MENFNGKHVLVEMGVLSSFSVARKITEYDIEGLTRKIKKKAKNKKELDLLLKKEIMNMAKKSLESDSIPGLLDAANNANSEKEKKRFITLAQFASIISNKMLEKQMDKTQCCYIINYIVSMLNLTEKDFEDFHRKYSEGIDDENDENDEF